MKHLMHLLIALLIPVAAHGTTMDAIFKTPSSMEITHNYMEVFANTSFDVQIYVPDEHPLGIDLGDLTGFGFDLSIANDLDGSTDIFIQNVALSTMFEPLPGDSDSFFAYYDPAKGPQADEDILLATVTINAGLEFEGIAGLSVQGINDASDYGLYFANAPDQYDLSINETLRIKVRDPALIPEPGAAILMGLGLMGLAGLLRRKNQPVSA